MKLTVCAVLPLIALAACVSTNPDGSTAIGVVGSPAWFKTASPEVIAAHYQGICAGYGFKAGSNEMASCVQNEIQAAKSGNMQMMNAMNARNAAMIRRPVNCTTFGYSTTCY